MRENSKEGIEPVVNCFAVTRTLLFIGTCLIVSIAHAQDQNCDQSVLTTQLVTTMNSQGLKLKRQEAMVLLFLKGDVLLPLCCTKGKKLLYGEACVHFMPANPQVRLMTGKTIKIGKTKSEPGGFFWSDS